MGLKDIMGSGVMGVLPAIASKNPDALRPFGVLGNLAANKLEDDEEKKKQPGMKKGGRVKSSASKRADGCAIKGKTKGRMV